MIILEVEAVPHLPLVQLLFGAVRHVVQRRRTVAGVGRVLPWRAILIECWGAAVERAVLFLAESIPTQWLIHEVGHAVVPLLLGACLHGLADGRLPLSESEWVLPRQPILTILLLRLLLSIYHLMLRRRLAGGQVRVRGAARIRGEHSFFRRKEV